jgi:hypothetical protein
MMLWLSCSAGILYDSWWKFTGSIVASPGTGGTQNSFTCLCCIFLVVGLFVVVWYHGQAHRLSAHFDSAEASTSGRTEGYYPYTAEDDYADDYLMPFPSTGANDRFMSGIPVSNLMRPGEFKPYMNPHYFPEDLLPYRLEDLKEVS